MPDQRRRSDSAAIPVVATDDSGLRSRPQQKCGLGRGPYWPRTSTPVQHRERPGITPENLQPIARLSPRPNPSTVLRGRRRAKRSTLTAESLCNSHVSRWAGQAPCGSRSALDLVPQQLQRTCGGAPQGWERGRPLHSPALLQARRTTQPRPRRSSRHNGEQHHAHQARETPNIGLASPGPFVQLGTAQKGRHGPSTGIYTDGIEIIRDEDLDAVSPCVSPKSRSWRPRLPILGRDALILALREGNHATMAGLRGHGVLHAVHGVPRPVQPRRG